MPSTPVALHEPPRTVQEDSVPRVPESAILEPHPRLVAGTFAESLDHHTVQTSVTRNERWLNIRYEMFRFHLE